MSFADLTLRAYLEEVAARQTAPGAGVVAATVVGSAASLVAMAARFAAGGQGGPPAGRLGAADGALVAVAAGAEGLRDRALELGDADAQAYASVIEASRRPAGDPGREAAVAAALARACDVPLEILAVACEVAALGVDVYDRSTRDLRGDAATAVLLAEAAGRGAAELVDINVRRGGIDPERSARGARLAGRLVRAAGQVPLGLRHD